MKVIVQLRYLGKENTRRTLSCANFRCTGETQARLVSHVGTRVQKSGVASDLYHIYSPRIKKD